jgi:EAL domain-containing protein (putative c-di-GMP-specific phosphodiesterase class I)
MTAPFETNSDPSLPYLEHYPEPGGPPQRIVVEPLPFRIGRSPDANFIIYSRQVSKEHTEIFRFQRDFRIKDLGSTNGTFVNGQRIQEAALLNGDIIHVAHKELRFTYEPNDTPLEREACVTEPAASKLPSSIIRGSEHLREMLTENRGRAVFQPIVYLDSGMVMGYEVLGRGDHPELSASPGELFHLAAQCNLAVELSRMFRTVAVPDASRLPQQAYVFLNLHPLEMKGTTLLESLAALKGTFRQDQQLVLEVHEAAVTEVGRLRLLRESLKELGIGLAYDDFGAGQSRLNELAEVPPDFIKLDMSLIHGIEQAQARQEVVQALTRVARDLGVQTIAEGIETAEEAQRCLSLGCQLGQGYLFGRPQPLELLIAETLAASVRSPLLAH